MKKKYATKVRKIEINKRTVEETLSKPSDDFTAKEPLSAALTFTFTALYDEVLKKCFSGLNMRT